MSESLRAKVFSGLLWSAIRVWGNRLGGLIIFLVLARLLSPTEFGIYAAIWAVLLFLEVFTEQGLADAIVQAQRIEPEQLNAAFLVNFFAALAICAGLAWQAPVIAAWLAMPAIVLPLQVASVSIVLNALGFCQLALYRRQFQYRWLAMRSLLATLFSGGVGIGLALKGYGVWALVGQYLAAALCNLLLLWVRPLWRPSSAISWRGLAQLLRFSLKLLLSRLLEACNARAFELAIGAWMGAAMLGLYSVSARVHLIVIQLLSSVVLDVGLSGFSRLADDRPRFTQAYYQALTATTALAMPVFVLLAAVAPEFCMAVFGPQWQASGPILRWLALLGAVQSIQYINGAAITALGRSDKTLVITSAKTAATLMVLFTYGHGELLKLVEAFVCGQLLVSPLGFALGKRQIGFDWRTLLLTLWPYPAAASAAYFAVGWLRQHWVLDNAWLGLILFGLSGAAVYSMLSIALNFKVFATTLRYLRQS